VISASFASTLDSHLSGEQLSGQAAHVVSSAKSRPLAGGDEAGKLTGSERTSVGSAIETASRDAFRLAAGLSAGLMFAGGLISAFGIQNPRRRPAVVSPAPAAVTAGECARVARIRDPEPVPGELGPASDTATAPL
jgi:hypothetical protein